MVSETGGQNDWLQIPFLLLPENRNAIFAVTQLSFLVISESLQRSVALSQACPAIQNPRQYV
jgi:hypothetical protein